MAPMPIAPPAPARFSTIIGCFSDSVIAWPSARAVRSVAPPGGKLTIRLIGWRGYVSACACGCTAAAAIASTGSIFVMLCMLGPLVSLCCRSVWRALGPAVFLRPVGHELGAKIGFQSFGAAFAAIPAFLYSTKWRFRKRNRRRIDAYHSGLQAIRPRHGRGAR